jgi:hypothetical protein
LASASSLVVRTWSLEMTEVSCMMLTSGSAAMEMTLVVRSGRTGRLALVCTQSASDANVGDPTEG